MIVGKDGVAADTSKSGCVIVTVPEVLTRISLWMHVETHL